MLMRVKCGDGGRSVWIRLQVRVCVELRATVHTRLKVSRLRVIVASVEVYTYTDGHVGRRVYEPPTRALVPMVVIEHLVIVDRYSQQTEKAARMRVSVNVNVRLRARVTVRARG